MSEAGVRKRRQPAQRSSRPCDACRRRKSRCIIAAGQQKCSFCLHRKNGCTFDEDPPRRETHAAVELTPAVQTSPSPHELLHLEQPGGHSNERPAPHASTHTSGLDAQKGLYSENTTWSGSLGLNSSKFAELYGLGSDMEPILMRHRPYDAFENEYTLPTHSIRLVSTHDTGVDYPVTFHMVKDDKSSHFVHGYSDVDAIEACVRPYGAQLLQLFWKMMQPSYPIVHKPSFVEKYAVSYRCIDAPLLGAVYLSAMQWWNYDSHLSNQRAPEPSSLRRLTLSTIQDSYHRPRLFSIEAILLFLQCKPEDPLNPDHTFARGLTSQALAIGEAVGLHLDASKWKIPSWERCLRKRLSWALFQQDVWTALAHGRPTHITEENWAVTNLSDDDFDGETSIDEGSHFIQMTSLSRILYSILKTFYTVRSTICQDTVQLFTMAAPLWTEIENWHAALPSSLRMDHLPSRQLCPNGNIHLAYCTAKINILRRLVRSTALAPLCLDISVLSSIRHQAHETAKEAVATVASLRLEHLDAFWCFASPYYFSIIGSFCTLLLVTSLTPTERDHWRETLRSYLWTLRVGSKSNEPMRYAVNRLEGAILRGLEHALAVFVDATSPVTPEATSGQLEADINGFGFTLPGFEDLDFGGMDLEAFDFLNNTSLVQNR
ncbi:hypothetical protein P280DRAFT_389599 [Massarina eburnea CBS 473.64]|uniref:Zn(2)-C6 fungal-type domain-containing protein n=1 Tax=Massarina eburnea CBS 473.64 TaxID=1395130 RepID=A0A6A6SCE1_9PLEO|nr:hypothetical protein P280DRAFT_389599 [Massarina eburnea CBS 473.64]